MTSFYRFLLLRIEEASKNSEWAIKKILKNQQTEIFLIFVIIAVRKLGIKNSHRFTHLRTFKKKRLEIQPFS